MAVVLNAAGAAVALTAGLAEGAQPGRLIGIVCGLGLVALAWWAFPLTRTVFHRAEGLFVHEERRLTGKRLTPRPLDSILGARVEATWSDSSRQTRLVLDTSDGPLPLECTSGNGNRLGVESTVNDWLTRPV